MADLLARALDARIGTPEPAERLLIDGHFVTLTTNQFSEGLQPLFGPHVTQVQRMSLEEIFVANVMHHREARGL